MRPSAERPTRLRNFAFAVPATLYALYFLALLVTVVTACSTRLWAGAIVLLLRIVCQAKTRLRLAAIHFTVLGGLEGHRPSLALPPNRKVRKNLVLVRQGQRRGQLAIKETATIAEQLYQHGRQVFLCTGS